MKLRLGLHQLPIDELQHSAAALGERVVDRFLDCVIGVASGGVHMRDRMANGTGDACMRCPVVAHVQVGIIKCSAEKRHRIMAARAKSGGLHIAVALEQNSACLREAKKIRLVVERAKVMHAVKPTLVDIRMTLLAILIHHQRVGRDEVSGSCPR